MTGVTFPQPVIYFTTCTIFLHFEFMLILMLHLYGTGSRLHSTTRCGPGSSVGIATGYGLDGPGIESR